MKIRETINSNAEKFAATVYENRNKIVVVKYSTYSFYDSREEEQFTFDTVSEFRAWVDAQDWIVPAKVKRVSAFRKVKA